jgi:hypothetical protein
MNEYDSKLISFKNPFTMLVAGPSSSGKTTLIRKIFENYKNLFFQPPNKLNIKWCYGSWQSDYDIPLESNDVNLIYEEGFPNSVDNFDVIVFDDLMNELSGNKQLANLFTKFSHHKNISVIFIVQNIFHQGKEMRNISLNSQYIILTKNKRDASQITSLARQIFSTNPRILIDAYQLAINLSDFGYLLIDLTPQIPNELQLRSDIISINPIVFVPNVGSLYKLS